MIITIGQLIGTLITSSISGMFFFHYLYADDIWEENIAEKRIGSTVMGIAFLLISILIAVL
jgi:hypothetical protein